MDVFLQYAILGLVILVIIAETYKAKFEKNKESQDERGLELNYKVKSLSYSILSGGIILGAVLTGLFDFFPLESYFIIVMITFFIQSIISSIYLYQLRKI